MRVAFLHALVPFGLDAGRDLQAAHAGAKELDLALDQPQGHGFLRRPDRVHADHRPVGNQRGQGNAARVVRGQEEQRRLVRAVLVGGGRDQRQHRMRPPLLDVAHAPFHEIEHGDLLAQQGGENLAVVTELGLFFPPHVIGRCGIAAVELYTRHDSLSVDGVAAKHACIVAKIVAACQRFRPAPPHLFRAENARFSRSRGGGAGQVNCAASFQSPIAAPEIGFANFAVQTRARKVAGTLRVPSAHAAPNRCHAWSIATSASAALWADGTRSVPAALAASRRTVTIGSFATGFPPPAPACRGKALAAHERHAKKLDFP